jgi:dihydroxyacid dehydratase/phosphogluconate dehydratase
VVAFSLVSPSRQRDRLVTDLRYSAGNKWPSLHECHTAFPETTSAGAMASIRSHGLLRLDAGNCIVRQPTIGALAGPVEWA